DAARGPLIDVAMPFASGVVDKARSVGRPGVVRLVRRIDGKARAKAARNVKDPEITIASGRIGDGNRRAAAIRGQREVGVVGGGSECARRPAFTVEPGELVSRSRIFLEREHAGGRRAEV